MMKGVLRRVRISPSVSFKTMKLEWLSNREGILDYAVEGDIVYFINSENYLCAVNTRTWKEKWQFKFNSWLANKPTIANNVVYFGSGDHYLYALDIETGKEQWKRKINGGLKQTVHYDGTLCFKTWKGYIYCVDAITGKKNWQFKSGNVSRICVVNGVLYFCNAYGIIYGLECNTLKQLFKFEMKTVQDLAILPGPLVTNSVVYINWSDGFYALDSGKSSLRWKWQSGEYAELPSPPLLVNNVIYFLTDEKINDKNERNILHALDATTGKEVWNFETRPLTRGLLSAPLAGGFEPVIANNFVYLASLDGNIYALNSKSGIPVWKFEGGQAASHSPFVSGNKVYSLHRGTLFMIDINTGREMAKLDISKFVPNSIGAGFLYPVFINDMIFFITYTGSDKNKRLCAVKLD